MALSEYKHHTSRGQRMDRAGEWERAVLHGHVPEHPTSQAAGTEYFSLVVEDVPAAGSRPHRLAGVWPQERVQQHPVHQIVDTAPVLPILDVPVPLMGEQLVDVLRFERCVLLPSRLPTCPRSCSRTSIRDAYVASRRRNSWWKCRRSYPIPCCSGLWRPSRFSPRTEFILTFTLSN